MSGYRPRRPVAAPTRADLAERDAFRALTAESLPSVRSNAETWRNGLTAFITLVTTGIVIKGRDTTSLLPTGWRVAVTLLIGGGLALAVLGLWQTLAAQAGTRPGLIGLPQIHREYGSVAAYQVALARSAADRLGRARPLVGGALVLLLAGIVATWWAPKAAPTPAAYLQVSHGTATTCGTLQSADGGQLRIKVAGTHDPVVVPRGEVTNLRIVAKCG